MKVNFLPSHKIIAMKKLLNLFLPLLLASGATLPANAQTAGTLTLTFTQQPHTSYSGTQNVMAVWIQTSGGNFVKTRTRNVGNGTKDHLPTWAVNSGGTSGNALGSGCNTVGATTGATLTNFGTRTITWDGTDASGNIVTDGSYKITVQSTWNHGGSGTTTTSYAFTKGPSQDSQTPANDANFINVSLSWIPSAAGVTENEVLPDFTIFPNPSTNGLFTLNYSQSKYLIVYDMMGNIVIEQTLDTADGTIAVDLSSQANGNYIVHLTDGINVVEAPVTIAR